MLGHQRFGDRELHNDETTDDPRATHAALHCRHAASDATVLGDQRRKRPQHYDSYLELCIYLFYFLIIFIHYCIEFIFNHNL